MEKILSKIYLSNDNIQKEYICIWDTGAMETLISKKVIDDFNPEQCGYVYLNTIHGEEKSYKYIVNITLENHTKSIKNSCVCFGESREFDILIGMDIIQHGLFVIGHGNFSFSIEQLK